MVFSKSIYQQTKASPIGLNIPWNNSVGWCIAYSPITSVRMLVVSKLHVSINTKVFADQNILNSNELFVLWTT